MPSGYAPLSNPSSAQDAEREMEDAFDLNDEQEDIDNDDEHADEQAPLTRRTAPPMPQPSSNSYETSALPRGAYDFEREYDLPPPGSPPRPSERALPNDFGNSNGLLPIAPISRPQPRRSFFQNLLGRIIPSQYQPVATDSHPTRVTGAGTDNDGVFANVTAKPAPARVIRTENGDIHIAPEESQKELPPVSFSILMLVSVGVLITVLSDVSGGPGRCCTTVLGDHNPCSFEPRPQCRPHHRRPSDRFLPYLLSQRFHIILFPIRRIPAYISPTHLTCRQVWFSGRLGLNPHSVWIRFSSSELRRGPSRWDRCPGNGEYLESQTCPHG